MPAAGGHTLEKREQEVRLQIQGYFRLAESTYITVHVYYNIRLETTTDSFSLNVNSMLTAIGISRPTQCLVKVSLK